MTLDWDLQEAVWEEFEMLSGADRLPVGENRVETELVENYHGRGQARDFTFESDEPGSMAGGGDEGPRPLEYFLAGFAFCQQVLLAKHALATGVELDDVNVEVEGDVDP
ncbi:MAG: OsmC family protein, partial [Halobacterium sp.]